MVRVKDEPADGRRAKQKNESDSNLKVQPPTPRNRATEKARRRVAASEQRSPTIPTTATNNDDKTATTTTTRDASSSAKAVQDPDADEDAPPAKANHEANSRKAVVRHRKLVPQQKLRKTSTEELALSDGSPITIISAATTDPFDTFPLPSEPHAPELISLYVDSSLFTTDSVKGNDQGIQKELTLRRAQWFPLAIQSPAGYAAMIAYLETAHGNPRNANNDAYRRQYLAIGLEHLKHALRNPATQASDSTCFAVVLFLMVALQLNDFEAVQSHVLGLATIVSRRKQLSLGKIGSNQQGPPLKPPRNYNNTAFPYLEEQGLLSKRMAEILHHNYLLGEYIFIFQQDMVSGLGSAQHVWKPEDFPTVRSPFEHACLNAFRVWVVRVALKNPPTMPRQTMMQLLHRSLQGVDRDQLFSVCPSAMLWMALVAGPEAEGTLVEFYTTLLRRAQATMFMWSFQAAVQLVAEKFFWNFSLNTTTERFWDGVINSSSLVEVNGNEDSSTTLAKTWHTSDHAERSLTLQPKIALQGPRDQPG